jgi:uncharacterized protein YuzE
VAETLKITYDRVGDILHIDKVAPYPEQDSEELDQEVVTRLNPTTGEVENIEILCYSARTSHGEVLELPLTASFRLAI